MIGYARVSTAEQASSGLGIAAQAAAIQDAAARNGWELVEIVRDEGASGKDLDRVGLRRVLESIASGDADGVVAAKLDRVSRSLVHVAHLLDWFTRADATLVALDVGLDTSTPAGRLVASVMASVGQWERETIAARTVDALAVRRSQGKAVSRPAVAERAPEVAERIRDERAAGRTWQAIADGLNEDGIPTVRGGAMWRVSAVQSAAGYRRPPARPKDADLPVLRRRRAKPAARP
jgi:DNA invertase Pin-like site-specific DNA recombinase